ncbi:GNAT family N-acetyltransferase [Streptomyces sp. NPDC092046]|uniref:GNAT family N-acetyltransferase n=1 Tax=Streptomyces sp. NPDC092046 TaxID=3366009 RepID=UPI003825F185
MELPQPAVTPAPATPAPTPAPAALIRIDDDLVLRPFDPGADLDTWVRVIDESLEHLRPWMPWAAEHSRDRTAGFLAGRAELWEAGEEFSYAVAVDGRLVGTCGLFRHEDTPEGAYEIGYWLHPAATGRGIATRAAAAMVQEGFRLPGVDELLILHDAANHSSGAVAARLGFTEAGVDADGLRTWRSVRAPRQ